MLTPSALRTAPRYARSVLFACPFCREMFAEDEQNLCPTCGVALVRQNTLPLSDDALNEDGLPHQPEWDLVPLTYLGRGRGPLALLSVVGLVTFFLPWVHLTMPDIVSFSGFALARRLGWAWGGGVAWFVLLPTVLSRRTIMHMRGARVAAAFLSAVPGLTAALILGRSKQGAHGLVSFHFTWDAGIYLTLVLSVIAVGFSLFFGGRVDDIKVRRGTSAGQMVH
jgi:hypothetical protein